MSQVLISDSPFPETSKTGDAPPITTTPTGATPGPQVIKATADAAEEIARKQLMALIGQTGYDINIDRGWEVFRPEDFPKTPADRDATHKLLAHVALFHSEASEAAEEVRRMDKVKFTEELADVVIRLASVAFGLGLGLDQAIADKLRKNATREYRHGNKAL